MISASSLMRTPMERRKAWVSASVLLISKEKISEPAKGLGHAHGDRRLPGARLAGDEHRAPRDLLFLPEMIPVMTMMYMMKYDEILAIIMPLETRHD